MFDYGWVGSKSIRISLKKPKELTLYPYKIDEGLISLPKYGIRGHVVIMSNGV